MTPNDTQIQNIVTRDIDWARHHLFLLVAVAVLVVGGIFSIENLLANRAHDQWEQSKAILAQMQQQNVQTQAATKAEIDALNQQNTVLQQQFTALSTAIASRDAQLLKDRQEIKTLPPSQLATKWGAAANEPAPTIAANGNFDVSLPLAQKSTDALIQLPVLSKDVSDLQSSLSLSQQTAVNNQKKYEDEQKAHNSDKETCKQNVDTLNNQITSIKADARKDNFIAAFVGTVIGYAVGSRHR